VRVGPHGGVYCGRNRRRILAREGQDSQERTCNEVDKRESRSREGKNAKKGGEPTGSTELETIQEERPRKLDDSEVGKQIEEGIAKRAAEREARKDNEDDLSGSDSVSRVSVASSRIR